MLSDSHPDVIEFIISKMQNPDILRFIIKNTDDEEIKGLAKEKLKFTPLTTGEKETYEGIVSMANIPGINVFSENAVEEAKQKLEDGGVYDVHNPEMLSGANISIAVSDDFMEAVRKDGEWALRFPDTENYSKEEMAIYDAEWHEVGDVREWEERGHAVKTYRTIQAKELWQLINTCATYAAEPGIFYIDRANKDTNAQAYGQKVVATNPCGEVRLM